MPWIVPGGWYAALCMVRGSAVHYLGREHIWQAWGSYAQELVSFPGCTTVLGMKLAQEYVTGMYQNNSKNTWAACASLKSKEHIKSVLVLVNQKKHPYSMCRGFVLSSLYTMFPQGFFMITSLACFLALCHPVTLVFELVLYNMQDSLEHQPFGWRDFPVENEKFNLSPVIKVLPNWFRVSQIQ